MQSILITSDLFGDSYGALYRTYVGWGDRELAIEVAMNYLPPVGSNVGICFEHTIGPRTVTLAAKACVTGYRCIGREDARIVEIVVTEWLYEQSRCVDDPNFQGCHEFPIDCQ